MQTQQKQSTAEYNKEYHQTHKAEAKKYRQDHKEKITKYNKEYHQTHKEQAAKWRKKYRQDHKEQLAKYDKEYNQIHQKKKVRQRKERYQTHKKEAKEYYQSHREQIAKRSKEYRQSHKKEANSYQRSHRKQITKNQKKYTQTDKGKVVHNRTQAKRYRDLGFNPLNKPFSGSVWHHINDRDVVAIPKEVHLKFYASSNRTRHRRLIWQYYGRSLENMMNGVLPFTREGIEQV